MLRRSYVCMYSVVKFRRVEFDASEICHYFDVCFLWFVALERYSKVSLSLF